MSTLPLGRRWAPVTAFLIAISLLAPVPWVAAPAEAAADTPFTFEGGGWGHAVGLSQYGAYGMAKLDGQDYRTILDHYFTGTTIGTLGADVAAAEPLWVNLEREATSVTLQSYAIGSQGAAAELRRDNEIVIVESGDTITIEANGMTADGVPTCRLRTSGGHDSAGTCTIDLEWDGTTPDPTTRFSIENVKRAHDTGPGAACTNLDWNTIPSTVRTCSYSRGVMHVRPDNDSVSFHLVVELDIEDYLLGISEMPYHWAEPADGPNGLEALKAQVVAARSYAIHRQIDRGDAESRRDCSCNVVDTSVDQRYVGWGHSGIGQSGWLDAVRSTAGEVLLHPSSTNGSVRIPAEAFYGSSSYGRTEPASVVFGENVPYLQSVDDHWAMEPSLLNPESRWVETFTGADLAGALGWTGRSVESVDVVSCSPSGAVDELRFRDENGAAEIVRGRSLWPLLGLRSPQITNVGAPPPATPPCGGLGQEIGGMAGVAVVIDDNASGDSIGNDDGSAQCGETIEVLTAVENQLLGRQQGLQATVSSADPLLTVIHNVASPIPDLGPGERGANTDDWDVTIAAAAPDGHVGTLEVSVTSNQGGPWVLDFEIPVGCPASADPEPVPAAADPGGIVSTGLTVDDGVRGDSVGNNDAAAQCGETVELYLAITNTTAGTLDGVAAAFATSDPYLTLLHNVDSAYPSLAAAATAENVNDWDVAIDPSTPSGHVADLEVTVTSGPDEWTLTVPLAIGCEATPLPGPTTAAFSVARVTIDDGVRGDSVGNNDRIAQCGETIELYVDLTGTSAVRATATISLPDDRLTLLYNATSAYPALRGGTAENENDWDIRIAETVPDGLTVMTTLELVDDGGGLDAVTFPLIVSCPGAEPAQPLTTGTVTVDDGVRGDSVGNNDKIAHCGETIELYVVLNNRGTIDLGDVTATLTTTDPNLTLLYNDGANYGTIAGGGSAENLDDWDLRVSSATPDGHVASVRLEVATAEGARWSVPVEVPISCN